MDRKKPTLNKQHLLSPLKYCDIEVVRSENKEAARTVFDRSLA